MYNILYTHVNLKSKPKVSSARVKCLNTLPAILFLNRGILKKHFMNINVRWVFSVMDMFDTS